MNKNQDKKKERNQHRSVLKLLYYSNTKDPLIIPLIFIFLSCCEKAHMITKNSVVKIKNLVVNHESRPVKSNHDMYNEA